MHPAAPCCSALAYAWYARFSRLARPSASVISVCHRIYEQDHKGDELSNNNNPINNFIDKLIFHVLTINRGLSMKIGTVDSKFKAPATGYDKSLSLQIQLTPQYHH